MARMDQYESHGAPEVRSKGIPIILPALSCRTERTFHRPFLTTGTEASFWYWLKDQSLGLMDAGEESRRIGFRCWRRGGAIKVVHPIAPANRKGPRREWWKIPGIRKAMADSVFGYEKRAQAW